MILHLHQACFLRRILFLSVLQIWDRFEQFQTLQSDEQQVFQIQTAEECKAFRLGISSE